MHRQCCYLMFGDLKSENRIKISHELMKIGFFEISSVEDMQKYKENGFCYISLYPCFAAMQKCNKTWIAWNIRKLYRHVSLWICVIQTWFLHHSTHNWIASTSIYHMTPYPLPFKSDRPKVAWYGIIRMWRCDSKLWQAMLLFNVWGLQICKQNVNITWIDKVRFW